MASDSIDPSVFSPDTREFIALLGKHHRCEELMEEGIVVQFGVPPNRIDLINRIDGVSFQEAWASRVCVTMPVGAQSVEVWLIGLGELIKNKEAVGRPKDIEDITFLRRARGQ
jgi:hypothetical protein